MVVPVPALYKAVLMERENHIGAWNKLVADAGLTEEQNSELQARIDHNFQVSGSFKHCAILVVSVASTDVSADHREF